ncbi:MAG: hypothetical protein ACK40G_10240 [Cytophagaceae bacterium]
MIRFFKKFDIIQLVVLFILLLLFRLPVFLNGKPLLLQELDWLLIGERLGNGFMMHRDIYDITGPFAAFTYYISDLIAGKSQISLFILSTLFVFVQAGFCVLIFNANSVFRERTTLPGLFYILFSSAFFDFYTLSPTLLGLTFLILSLHFLFKQVRSVITQELMFYTGLCIGVASLFSIDFSVFLLFAFSSTIFFANPDLRKALILVVGFFFPFMITGVYYFFGNGFGYFFQQNFVALFSYPQQSFFLFDVAVLISVIPSGLLLAGLAFIINRSKLINYQYNIVKIMFLWLIFSAVYLIVSLELALNSMLVFLPVLVFFTSHLFLLFSGKVLEESVFWTCAVCILMLNYGILYKFALRKKNIDFSAIVVNQDVKISEGKKILVLGNEKSFYHNNTLATPYFNWQLSEPVLRRQDHYSSVITTYKNFKSDLPEIIIDKNAVMPEVFNRIPELEKIYSKDGMFYFLKQ